NEGGGPIEASNLTRRAFHPRLKKPGLPTIRFHDLRHTCASLALAANIHPKVVSELLGHSQISITLDTYSHVMPNLHGDAVCTIGALLELRSDDLEAATGD